jgi:nucleotide-binding universal stress UspA family protein
VYKRILVGTDGSPTAQIAVDRAAEVARQLDAELTVLTAMRKTTGDQLLAKERERLAPTGLAVTTKVVEKDPATALIDEVEQGGYDLLVVGNKGMTGVGRFFLGSVPNKVSHHVPCSLLIVRTT